MSKNVEAYLFHKFSCSPSNLQTSERLLGFCLEIIEINKIQRAVVGMLSIQGRYLKTLVAFKDRIVKELGTRIKSIIVYGSVVRCKAKKDSDVDVLVLGEDKTIRRRISEIGYDIDYENDFETYITLICFTKDDLEHRVRVGSPFIFEVLRDGVALYDDGTFKRIREKVFRAYG